MAKFMNNQSSHSNFSGQGVGMKAQSTVVASCYSVNTPASNVNGFHYCTTNGTGKPFWSCVYLGGTGILNIVPYDLGFQWYP